MLYTHHQKLIPSQNKDELLPPVSIWTSLTGIFLIGTVATGITLSSWLKYNVVVKASATVRPTGEIRVVQSQIEGTVKNILVKENQSVKIGDVIAEIDHQQLLIKKNQLQENLQNSNLQLIKIDAQISNFNNQIVAESKVIETIITTAKADLERNQREYHERKINTDNEFLVSSANLQKAMTNLKKAEADLEFAKVDRDRYQQLSEIGAIGRREFEQKQLVVEQMELTLSAEKKTLAIANIQVKSAKAAVNPTTAMMKMAQERITQETARGKANLASLNKEKQALMERRIQLENQINQLQKELEQIENQISKSRIVSTSNGIILKLNLRNPGQVVKTSESIAEIVPNHNSLEIKAIVPTADIKKVAIGQQVQIRVNACPYPDYGTLNGVVKTVSPDAINTQVNTVNSAVNNSYFAVTIQPAKLTFGNHQKCHIQPGMEVRTDIISQQETALQFILRKARLVTDL
ncbi:MAG: HlyD family efflux transporter periplasmic adaptor subunit [Nostocales cyanobacterium]|nr:MAG: HlyD family efflux transporter periplasmic adaptor subunit [Nostocales cyanobacterium]